MSNESAKVAITIAAGDLADLESWARNSESSVEALLEEAVQDYLAKTRAWISDTRRRLEGPSYSLEEVKAHLAERRRQVRPQAAE